MANPEYDSWINSVREASDIVDVIGRTVSLRRRGKHYWGLCPFHSEKTPSFSVDPELQLFYCFGCHAGGSVYQFVIQHEGLDFMSVVRRLAEEAGIAEPKGKNDRQGEDHRPLYDVMTWTQEYFLQQRSTIEPYLTQRKLSFGVAEQFQLGYAPDSWHGLVEWLGRHKVKPETMIEAGVAVRRDQGGLYDRWRHRLTFPIWDRTGRIVAFGGRALDAEQQPKYLNSPETPLFHKGQLVYALHLARPAWQKGTRPLLVEGYFDVIAAHAAGLTQAVGTLGTALTSGQARLLGRFHAEVDLCYDQDEAGREASRRAFLLLSEAGLRVNLVSLGGDAKDPDELRQREGDAGLKARVSQARPYVMAVAEGIRASTPRERAQAVEMIRPLLLAVPDVVEQAGYIEVVARMLHIDPSILTQSLGSKQEDKHTSGKNRHNMGRTGQKLSPTLPSVDVELLAALLRHPDAIGEVRKQLPEWTNQEGMSEALEWIAQNAGRGVASWIDGVPSEARGMVMEANAWQGPDGGQAAILDFVARIKERYEQEGYHTLQERVRRGENQEDLMREVREAAERLHQLKRRKEG
ncbi:MAG: DNA primase [Firmicutes bacterium]|jgi:DNA primase|nr:DNA primase [Bacillota bacterium]MCL5064834.1 DNA primase [Bacillota bacterium]